MTGTEWLNSEEAVARSKRPYAHFDWRTDIDQKRAYIVDPHKVAIHGFYPFIHYEKRTLKFNKKKGKKEKIRDICYAAHIDRFQPGGWPVSRFVPSNSKPSTKKFSSTTKSR